jgi:hypothetical protein
MYVKVAFQGIFDYFQIFPDDKAKISLYLKGKTDPQSVVISPAEYHEPVCEPRRVADEIECNNMDVYCRDPTDDVVLRIVAAGEILWHEVNCGELTSNSFDYELMNQYLGSSDEAEFAAYMSNTGTEFDYMV